MQVMMIGTDLCSKGGVAAVAQGYFDAGIADRLSIDYYPTHCDGSKIRKIFFYFRSLLRIIMCMQRCRIVHVHMSSKWSLRRLFLPLIFANTLRKKKVIHLHGAMFDVYYNKARFLEKILIRYLFSVADKVIVLSNEWSRKITIFCELNKIVIIPNSVSIEPPPKDILSKKYSRPYRILFLGEIGPRKGAYDLLEAVRSLNMDCSWIRVELCGNGEIENIRKRVNELGLEKVSRIPGWVSGQEKQALLEEACLYVLPSYHEGLPMSILEALATGTPVITTAVGGIPDAVRDGYNGFLVATNSPRQLADRIEEVLNDKSLWRRLAKNALLTIRDNFSTKQTEKKLRDLYDSMK